MKTSPERKKPGILPDFFLLLKIRHEPDFKSDIT